MKTTKKLIRTFCLSILLMISGVGIASIQSLPALAANSVTPEWWGGNITSCDPAHHGGSWSVGQWGGFASCYPRPGTDVFVSFTRGGSGIGTNQPEWECVELVERYMFENWGITPYGANGAQIVSSWNNSIVGVQPIDVSGGNPSHYVPGIGDVLSFGSRGTTGGHTAIVTDVRQQSGSGNYQFTIFQQNASNAYDSSDITMSNWNMNANGYPAINGWLRQQNGNIGGFIAGINPPSQTKQVFTVDTRGQVVTSYQQGGGWSNWQEINTGKTRFPTTAHIGVVLNQSNGIEIFATDVNGNFWHSWGQTNSWPGWYQLDGQGSSDMTVANYDNNQDMVLWITGNDNSPYYRYSTNGSWGSWIKYANAQFPLGTRYILGRDSSSINVFALGGDGKIYGNYTPWGQENWQGAFFVFGNFGAGFSSDASTAWADNNGDEEVVAPQNDGTVWHDYESGGSWQGWAQISNSPKMRDSIAAIQTTTRTPEYYSKDVNNNVWHNWNTGCGNCYSGWNPFSAGIPFSSDPNAVDSSSDNPEIFITASDGKTYHQWLNSGSWSGWQYLGVTG